PAIRRRSARYPKEVMGVPGAGVRRGDDGPRCPVPMLGERLAAVVADGPAIRRRSTRHITEAGELRGGGGGGDGPRCPAPMLGERLAAVVADGPAIRRRSARYPKEVVRPHGIGRGDDGPRCPVPMLDQR